jgi:hypothetical protein
LHKDRAFQASSPKTLGRPFGRLFFAPVSKLGILTPCQPGKCTKNPQAIAGRVGPSDVIPAVFLDKKQ